MTDTIETGRRPCPCGNGEVVDYRETPDHGWSSGQWVSNYSRIECNECDRRYLVHHSGYVLRGDYEAREAAKRAVWEEEQQFLKSADVERIFDRLAQLLDDQPSIAARYRFLYQLELTPASESGFRKRWDGGASWASANRSVYTLRKLINVGAIKREKYPWLVNEVERFKQLDAANEMPLPVAVPVSLGV
jgi:hypothetical protein